MNQYRQENASAEHIRSLEETLSALRQELAACKRVEAEHARGIAFSNGILDQSLAGVYVINNGRFSYVNQVFADLFGYASPEEIVDKLEMINLVAPESRGTVLENVRKRISGESTEIRYTFSGLRKDGTHNVVEVHGRSMVFGGNRSVIGLILDVTDRKRSEQRLRQQAMVFNSIQEGIVITDPQCRVIDVNPAFECITEYSLDEIRGENMRFIQSGRQERSFYVNLWQCVLTTGNWQGEIWNRRKSGDIYLDWISISAVRDEAGHIANYVGTFVDISRMKHAQSEIERLAHHDGLTNLPNRSLLISRLQQAIDRGTRYRSLGAVLFVDLDQFKPVNDTLGHLAGDELLQKVASRLTGRLRGMDIVARLGGDEFVIVLEDIASPDAAAMLAQEVIRQLQTPFPLSCGAQARIGASVGIALFPQDGVTPTQLIERSDQALYVSKRGGRGIYRFFGES